MDAYMTDLENHKNYKKFGITAIYELKDKYMIISLSAKNENIGSIEIKLDGSEILRKWISDFNWFDGFNDILSFKYSPSFSTDMSDNEVIKIDQDLRKEIKLLNIVLSDNTISYFESISIEKEFQGKGLSYPLMCMAFKIVSEIHGKKYIILYNASGKPNLYINMGFKNLYFK